MQPDASSLDGLAVAAFESRRASDLARLIEKQGGIARVSPSLREIPTEDTRSTIEFAHRLVAGQVDAMIFLTGVGVRYLVEQVERHLDRERFLSALSDIPVVARGPKPQKALNELGVKPTLLVPEPNTWRDLLATLDQRLPVTNLTVGLQEYGVTNPSLIAGLEARGAVVERVRVYDWELPEDLDPLERNLRKILAGEADIALFTAAQQVENLRKLAQDLDLLDSFDQAIRRCVVGSIGPTTSERLRSHGMPVDVEASPPKMGQLVKQVARDAQELKRRKQSATFFSTPRSHNATDETLNDAWSDSLFMRACRRQPTEVTPVWLMRQAGRYMPEYREVRSKIRFLDLCRNPALCSEVMCTAVDFLKVDAAIIFSDLLPLLEPLGFDLEFSPGDGPVIHNPIRESSDVDQVLDLTSVDSLHYVFETVRQTRLDLPEAIPLIGFAGAPFTLASYAIEGGASRSYLHTKTLMHRDPGAWDALMQRLADAVTRYLNAQIAAGAQAVQLFDSWVGCLSVDDYRRCVAPYVAQVVQGLTPGTPVIHFGTGNPELLASMSKAGGDVLGVDWRIPLDEAWRRVGDRAVQGNLDPALLLADRGTIRRRTEGILEQAGKRPGHIFNLGHGVLQQTPPENARALVEMVHELSAR